MGTESEKKIEYLSASKIDTIETCSWLYYCKYKLRLPDDTNDGARRGSAVHDLLECLCTPKRKKYIDLIENGTRARSVPEFKRFFRKKFKSLGLNPDAPIKKGAKKTNETLVYEMLETVLRFEFFEESQKIACKKIIHSELKFDHVNEEPRYAVRGFIDRISEISNEDGTKELEILDYKSSKAKFTGDKKEGNLQGMIYTLIAKKRWKNYSKFLTNFFFMRFPEDPYQKHEFSDDELAGLESYLEHVTERLENFTEKDAVASLAASKGRDKSWLCGMGSWKCPFRDEFFFYSVPKNNGENENFLEFEKAEQFCDKNGIDKDKISIEKYEGCPAWKKPLDFLEN